MTLEYQLVINCPIEDVWNMVTNPVFMIFWQDGYESTVMLEGAQDKAGGIASHAFADGKKKFKVREEIRLVNPPHRKEAVMHYPAMTQHVTLELEGDQETTVSIRIEARMTAFSFRILAPWMKGSFQKKLEEDMIKIKTRMEGAVLKE